MAQNLKTTDDTQVILEEMRAQIAALTERVARLEAGCSKIHPASAIAVEAAAKPAAPVKQEITEAEVLAVSAALGAYLGVRVHVRQMRLLSSSAWTQQGRVLVHAHIPYIY